VLSGIYGSLDVLYGDRGVSYSPLFVSSNRLFSAAMFALISSLLIDGVSHLLLLPLLSRLRFDFLGLGMVGLVVDKGVSALPLFAFIGALEVEEDTSKSKSASSNDVLHLPLPPLSVSLRFDLSVDDELLPIVVDDEGVT